MSKMFETNGGGVIDENLVDFIKKHNAQQSAAYTEPSAQMKRRLYRVQHPTQILVPKCMDGRLNLSIKTETPPGILEPFRNIGGSFDLGWPFFQEVINDSINFAINKGRRCCVFTSYHFAKGDPDGSHHRGCAGFGYDTKAAKEAAFSLRKQFSKVYGTGPVYALTIGIETDEASLIFHGVNGDELLIADLNPAITKEEIIVRLEALYPDMDKCIIVDLVPLIKGNLNHVQKCRNSVRELIDLEHREQIIAVGRGFDWLHLSNTALIIGPYSHQWTQAVMKAGKIIMSNITSGRIPKEHGVLLMPGALYRQEEGSAGWRLKEMKVRYLLEAAEKVLREEVPEIIPYLQTYAGVVDADTRKFHPLSDIA